MGRSPFRHTEFPQQMTPPTATSPKPTPAATPPPPSSTSTSSNASATPPQNPRSRCRIGCVINSPREASPLHPAHALRRHPADLASPGSQPRRSIAAPGLLPPTGSAPLRFDDERVPGHRSRPEAPPQSSHGLLPRISKSDQPIPASGPLLQSRSSALRPGRLSSRDTFAD